MGIDGGTVGFDEHTQKHSVAPTLPIHSPHSPLLADENTTEHLKKNKLSARYINNTGFLCNINKTTINNYSKLVTESSSATLTSNSTTSSSKLLCYCEKRGSETLEHSNNRISLDNTVVTKRWIATRNAATSPHLDVRKLGSMTTLTPSPSLVNDISLKSTDFKTNKQNALNIGYKKSDEKGNHKQILKKNNSVGEYKPVKLLRTTRSLSPRPPMHHQQALLVSDLNTVDIKFPCYPYNDERTNRQQSNKLCRSEQSSPNVIDGTNIQFSYNESNRSTGCLGNVFSDPWLKIAVSENISPTNVLNSKEENKLHSTNLFTENSKDPWVKRVDVDTISKASRHELFRQSKSFSASKFDVETLITTPAFLNNSKHSVINMKKQLQSAPSSPQFLTATEKTITSATNFSNQHFVGTFSEKTPTRSSSFSPARIKDCYNPFTDYNSQIPISPPPSISVATDLINEQNRTNVKSNNQSSNYDLLNVCNPNFLNARHSISTVSDQQQGEELQLNIRRLSDQMCRKKSIFTNSIKTFSSDRNVRENQNDENKVFTSPNDRKKQGERESAPANRADFSEYLEQFRCSEAKKAAVNNKKIYLWNEKNKLSTKTTPKQPVVLNKAQQSTDCLLETTC